MIRSLTRFVVMLAAAIVSADAFAQAPTPRTNILRNGRTPLRPGATPSAQPTQAKPEGGATEKVPNKEVPTLQWNAAPLDLVLDAYSKQVGKTILKDPAVPNATITLKSCEGQKMTEEEYLEAIEVVLEMNGIHIEPYGEKFLRALPRKEARKEGIPIIMDSETKLADSGKVVSMMVQLKNISTEDGQKALDNFKSGSGIIIGFERTNSILITDTEANINRMLEIIRCIDVATPVLENVFVRQIKNASAQDIKTALEAIVQESQKELEKSGGKNANVANAGSSSGSSLMRPGGGNRLLGGNKTNQPSESVSNSSVLMQVSDADRGMIRGKVLILADERSNKLVIVTQKPNMDFFDKVIEQLDVETTPDTVVKVYRLKYADAEEVSDMINDLIGNASGRSSSKENTNRNSKSGTSGNMTRGNTSSGSPSASTAQRKSANQRSGEAKAGELTKDNTTVLADKRINGLVVMTEKDLVPTLEQIIESMDVKLAQVLIETVIIEVGLNDDLKTGIDWVKGLQAKDSQYQQGLAGGGGSQSPVGGTNVLDIAGTLLPGALTPGGAGLAYAVMSEKFDLAAVISLSKSDTNSKYLASPVIMTVDNKEATIEATQMRYLFKGYQYSGSTYNGSAVPDYEQKELGITIKTTPKINPNGTVMLTVEEEYSQEGASQPIEGSSGTSGKTTTFNAATTITRKMSSDVSLENGQTVVLGGLVNTYKTESETGIPILKDIPWIGRFLFGKTQFTEQRNELIVFMTPYVLNDADAAEAEAIRRRNALSDRHAWEDHGWSDSKLADPVSRKEQMRRLKAEWKKQDAERKTRLEMEQEKLRRVERLERMSAKEREAWLEIHKAELEEEEKDKLEAKLLDDDSQEELKKLADDIRARKLEEADKALNKATVE